MKKIAIIVLHFRDLKNTLECVASIRSLKKVADLEESIIVVDNASSEPFLSDEVSLKVIRNRQNTGFTGGMNTGIKYALEEGFDFVATINNDTVFDKNFLVEIAKSLGNTEGLGILSPKIYFYPGSEFHYDRYKENERGKVIWFAGGKLDKDNFLPSHRGVDEVDHGQYDDRKQMDFSTGCCMIFPKNSLKTAGYFDEKYFLYYEDVDLSLRMRAKNLDLKFVPQAIIWHKNAKSAGGAGSGLQDYYTTRNRVLVALRYGGSRLKFAILREGFLLFLKGRKWQKIGFRDFLLGKFGKGSYPV